jgi:hypothetical protein
MTFVFNIAQVRPLLDHSLRARRHRSLYGYKHTARPGLFLVRDLGVYLMSNGNPGLRAGKHVQVVYAKRHDRMHYCGDDFAEFISARNLEKIVKRATRSGKKTFSVKVMDARIRLMV